MTDWRQVTLIRCILLPFNSKLYHLDNLLYQLIALIQEQTINNNHNYTLHVVNKKVLGATYMFAITLAMANVDRFK